MAPVVVLCAAITSVAQADPLVLCAPREGRSDAIAGAFPYLSARFRFDNGIWVALTTRFPLTSLAADVGYRRLLLGTEEGWSLAPVFGQASSCSLRSPLSCSTLALQCTAAIGAAGS